MVDGSAHWVNTFVTYPRHRIGQIVASPVPSPVPRASPVEYLPAMQPPGRSLSSPAPGSPPTCLSSLPGVEKPFQPGQPPRGKIQSPLSHGNRNRKKRFSFSLSLSSYLFPSAFSIRLRRCFFSLPLQEFKLSHLNCLEGNLWLTWHKNAKLTYR